jgi:exosortase A-associated hydrolase 1
MGAPMRSVMAFPCAGETLVGTLDAAEGKTGLLVVSGGNDIRIGAHRGMAVLAQRVAAAGHPVFRFDRRGIGDSSGINAGFESSADDIAAAATSFRREARLRRVVAFGNCDAATALALFHTQARIDALLLANPWAIEPVDDLPPAAAIRARYAEKLRDPGEWLRLARGGVDLRKITKGLAKIAERKSEDAQSLATRLAGSLAEAEVPITILLAARDATAIAFADLLHRPAFAGVGTRVSRRQCDTASHSFAGTADKDWLFAQVIEALGD